MLCRTRCPNTECRVRIILIPAVSIDPIRPCLSAESMQRAREEIVRDASVSFRAFSRGAPSGKDNSIHVERLTRISHRGLWERRFPLAEVSSWGGLDPDGIKRCPHSAWKLG